MEMNKTGSLPVALRYVPKPTKMAMAERRLISPLPGTVIAVLKNVGEAVSANEAVVIVEAMKMENEICASCDGVLEAIHVQVGDVIRMNTCVAEIKGVTD